MKMQQSMEVAATSDAETALTKLWKEGPFVAVLLDLIIPGHGAQWFLRVLHEDQKIKNIPVVAMTNSIQKSNRQKVLELGAKGYLLKSNHSLDDIIAQVKNVIAGKPCAIDG